MTKESVIADAARLSPSDRLDLLDAIWESLDETELPISQREKDLLDERMKDEQEHPEDQSQWSEVRDRLARRRP